MTGRSAWRPCASAGARAWRWSSNACPDPARHRLEAGSRFGHGVEGGRENVRADARGEQVEQHDAELVGQREIVVEPGYRPDRPTGRLRLQISQPLHEGVYDLGARPRTAGCRLRPPRWAPVPDLFGQPGDRAHQLAVPDRHEALLAQVSEQA